MIPRLVAALAMASRGTTEGAASGPMGARVLAALGGRITEERARAADRALILSAEHELNASTFAARVAASTGADPYSVLGAALATLSGPKHGGATERVEALVRESGSPGRAVRDLGRRLARGEVVPGFGHPLYPHGDPRVAPLLAAARASQAPTRRAADARRTLFALVDAMAARDRPPPTLDVALVATAGSLGLAPGGAALLFACGRAAGWIAHALEQYEMDELIRPRARYVGPRGRE
jgi:citrate synthase